MTYDLWYWPQIPGRGEFVRLALETGGIPYRDRAREEGVEALIRDMKARGTLFAPPYLVAGDLCIAQVATILLFLGERHGLAPGEEKDRLLVNQLQLTIADMVAEAHDVHHPVGAGLYYEDQKPEAARRAEEFREKRMPKYLGWFERMLAASGAGVLGKRWSYADLSLFQLVEGLTYAFPRRMAALAPTIPLTLQLRNRIRTLPELQDYFASGRRIAFNENGIFRHYPELDGD
jgi:glutathione S-transferase